MAVPVEVVKGGIQTMMNPRALILRAAGINNDREAHVACEMGGFHAEVVHVNRLIERPTMLQSFHLVVVPGGFSYGDDLGAGRILGNELRAKLAPEFRAFVDAGKLILGICNGFQTLVKAGLLPDPHGTGSPAVTLTGNDSGKFEDRWIFLKVSSHKSEFLQKGRLIELPIAHREGKFLPLNSGVLHQLEEEGQLVLKYVDPKGAESGYPWNPNGSASNVAGMCDPTGRILGLMPHPDRFLDALNHPHWTRRNDSAECPDGLQIFQNALAYVKRELL